MLGGHSLVTKRAKVICFVFVRKLICCMWENQRVDVGERKRGSNQGSLPSDVGELTGLMLETDNLVFPQEG